MRHGPVDFQAPAKRGRPSPRFVVGIAYLIGFAVWSAAGSLHAAPAAGLAAAFFYLVLAVAAIRLATMSGGVLYTEELAERIAGPLEALCARPAASCREWS